MNSFFKFAAGFGNRIGTISGLLNVLGSKPVQKMVHSPIMRWSKLVAAMIVVGIGFGTTISNFDKAREQVIDKEGDYRSHLSLAEEAAKLNDFELAEDELMVAKEVAQVLGAEADFGRVTDLVYPVDKLARDAEFLINELNQRPNYRDLILKIAVLYWQLNETDKATKYYEMAKYLDPNNENVVEVGKLVTSD